MKILYTERALRDLDTILGHTQTHSPSGAGKMQTQISDLIELLKFQQRIGIATKQRNSRRIVAKPLPVCYFMQGKRG